MNIITSDSELELKRRIIESDSEAVEFLYDKYSSLLYTFVKKIIKDAHLAEDILNDIFSILHQNRNNSDFNSGSAYTWLIMLAKNRAVYELRRRKNIAQEENEDLKNEFIIPKLSHIIEPVDFDKAYQLKDKIEAALNKLPEAQQYIIYLVFYEGITQEEIAAKLKIPLSIVQLKIRTAMVKVNEYFKEKPFLFTIKNETVELIYPFALGSFNYEEQQKIYERFKNSEPFPWKLLGEYQNLVALLPIILDLEEPPAELKEKLSGSILKDKKEAEETEEDKNKRKSFEEVYAFPSRLKIDKTEEEQPKNSRFERVKSLDEIEEEKVEKDNEEKPREFERIVTFKPSAKTYQHEKYKIKVNNNVIDSIPEDLDNDRKRNYASIIIIALIVVFIFATVMAYLFYQDRVLFYESEIGKLNNRVSTLINEYQNRPEIPGLGELRNSSTIELNNSNETISSGEIIFSLEDKRGYLHIRHLPILDSESAYQLWANFDGEFISLGVFKVSSLPDYYPFTLPPSVDNGPLEFIVIESGAEGSRRPGSKIYLQSKTE